MSNLLEETLASIDNSGHTIEDIVYIGSEDGYSCSWEQFKGMADVEYDSSYGSAEVATDLRIVFSDGQTMWRGEYDGSEWWEYSEPFIIPETTKPVKRVIGAFWPKLKNLQDDEDTHHNPSLYKEDT